MEKEIGRGERFKSFISEVGLTRHRVQQTELDQFAPPALRSKSRFMNVGKLLEWAMMVLYHLDHPSASEAGISDERMEEKLGWLREYADDLQSWNQCQKVIDQSLTVINTMGLDEHTPKLVEQALDERNPSWRQDDSSATRIGVKWRQMDRVDQVDQVDRVDRVDRAIRKQAEGGRTCLAVDADPRIAVWEIQTDGTPTQHRRFHASDRGDSHALRSSDPRASSRRLRTHRFEGDPPVDSDNSGQDLDRSPKRRLS